MTQAKLAVMLSKTLIQQTEEHIHALKALLKTLNSMDSMSETEREKFEAKIDALESHEKQQFNQAMAKARALGLVLH